MRESIGRLLRGFDVSLVFKNGSVTESNFDPIRKLLGVRAAKSFSSLLIKLNGLKFEQLSIVAATVNVSLVATMIL